MKFLLILAFLAAVPASFAARVVCYYASWSVYRPDPFKVEFIDPNLCTHVVYSFAGLDQNGYVKPVDPWNDIGDEWHEGGFKKFQKLKSLNPSVKLMLAVGGWNEGSVKFQAMVRNPQKRKTFLDSSLDFVRRYKFDGLEIAWVFQDSFGGTPEDKFGYSELVKEMKPVYERNGLILAASTSANQKVFTNSYDIRVLSSKLDYINIISYDLHGSWDVKTGHVAPLHRLRGEPEEDRFNNVEAVVNMYLEHGASPDKLTLGTVGYGRTFTLLYPDTNGINSPTTGPGKIEEPLPYGRFCVQDRNGFWKKFRSTEQKIPYAVAGDQWTGYEDVDSLTEKARFSKMKKLGGVSFFSLDQDDFKGACNAGKFPLLRALKEETMR